MDEWTSDVETATAPRLMLDGDPVPHRLHRTADDGVDRTALDRLGDKVAAGPRRRPGLPVPGGRDSRRGKLGVESLRLRPFPGGHYRDRSKALFARSELERRGRDRGHDFA